MLQVQTAIQQITSKVHGQHGVSEKQVETFANENQSDPDVSEQIVKLQTMIQNPTASLPCELPSDMNQARMLEIFEVVSEHLMVPSQANGQQCGKKRGSQQAHHPFCAPAVVVVVIRFVDL